MPMSNLNVNSATPYYVLLEESHFIGPNVMATASEMVYEPIYAFSNKVSYDKFCKNSKRNLRPYPLSKGYLRKEIDTTDDVKKLVLVDARNPEQSSVNAATIEAVLKAQVDQTAYVDIAYQFVFDQEQNAYRVEDVVM